MKSKVLFFLIFFGTTSNIISQDIITKKSGEDIISKVLEINLNEVKYKKWDNQDGPIFSISKSEILLIRYQNGTKDLFNEQKQTSVSVHVVESESFKSGQIDAVQF